MRCLHGQLIICFLAVLCSCAPSESSEPEKPENIQTYLFLAHTRTETNPKLIEGVAQIDFNQYNMIWLGGDMAQLSSENEETMTHLNKVFDLTNDHLFWALGNHDYSNPELIEKFTGKPPFYAQSVNGICLIVLDTQDSLSHIAGDQLAMFHSVLDTLSASTHLVLLHHKLIWLDDDGELAKKSSQISNAPIDTCSYCIQPNNFYEDIYPKLTDMRKKGIEVICIGGDIGFKSQKFQHLTDDGIHFLASGMSFNESTNYGLVFQHDLDTKSLKWSFELLEDL